MVHNITTEQLKGMASGDGLVLQGCGGDPAEWQKGINEMLTEAGILKNGGEFKDIHVFEHEGVTNILYHFEGLPPDTLDIGKLAMWRLQNHENFGGTWLSDYLPNKLAVQELDDADLSDSKGLEAKPAKEYNIGSGPDEFGVAVWNWNDQTYANGSEKYIAHINHEREITYFEDNLPEDVVHDIKLIAEADWKVEYAIEMAGLEYDPKPPQPNLPFGPHPSDMENLDDSTHPISVYIEKWFVPENGGFTLPLPASSDALQPFLDGIETFDWKDVAIINIESDIKGLGEKLQEIFAQEDMSPHRLNELNYLAQRIEDLSGSGYEIFAANIEAGRNCDSITEMINLTFNENLNRFDVQPAMDSAMYGEFKLEMVMQEENADAFHRLNESKNPEDRALAAYIEKLEAHIDFDALGNSFIQEEDGVFTDVGYLTGGDGLTDVYRGPHDIPAEHRIYSPPMPMVENVELSSLLMKLHALGGEYMQRADRNMGALMNRQDDELLLLADGKDIHLTSTSLAYRNGTDEHNKWRYTTPSPETRAFAVLPDDNGDKFAIGRLVEIDVISQQRDIIDNSIWFDQVEVVKKDGSEHLLSRAEWEGLRANDIGNVVSWRHIYEPADLVALSNHLDNLQNQRAVNVKVISAEDFLSDVNASYMARAECPKPDMLRITREAATEILARGDADVHRLFPNSIQQMSPMDAVKSKGLWYSSNREFAIKRDDAAGLNEWAERKTSEIVRKMERGERGKSKNKAEEL